MSVSLGLHFCLFGLACARVCMHSCVSGCLRVFVLGFECFGVFCRKFENISICFIVFMRSCVCGCLRICVLWFAYFCVRGSLFDNVSAS